MDQNETLKVCIALKDAGFPQRIENGELAFGRTIGQNDESAWDIQPKDDDTAMEWLMIPLLGEIEVVSREFFTQVAWTVNAGCFAYSNVTNPNAPAGTDPYIRANGTTEWEARANLYIAVKKGENHIVIPSQDNELDYEQA